MQTPLRVASFRRKPDDFPVEEVDVGWVVILLLGNQTDLLHFGDHRRVGGSWFSSAGREWRNGHRYRGHRPACARRSSYRPPGRQSREAAHRACHKRSAEPERPRRAFPCIALRILSDSSAWRYSVFISRIQPVHLCEELRMPQCGDSRGIFATKAASPRQRALFETYLFNLGHGVDTVSRMIEDDLRGYRDLGAQWYADDIAVVQQLFCSAYPNAHGCITRL